MLIEERPPADFWDFVKNVYNTPKYQNETLPALKFVDNAKRDLNIDIKEVIENENDPPDFDIITKNKKIALEVTTFTGKLIQKYNAFFRKIEKLISPIINKNISILPQGSYQFYYFPGANQSVNIKSMKIDIPDFRFKINYNDLEKQLHNDIPKWFKEYVKSGNDTLPIRNKNGEQVGKIRLIKWKDDEDYKFFIMPQSYTRLEEWEEKELTTELQKVLNSKENYYLNGDISWVRNYSEIWLLISDLQNIMGTSTFDFRESEILSPSKLFNKVFLIQDILTKHAIITLL